MGLVAGVTVLNAVFTAIGYSVLYPALRGSRPVVFLSWAGVALLVGAALSGVTLCMLAPLGVHIGLAAFAIVGGALAAAGIAVGLRLPPARLTLPRGERVRASWATTLTGDLAATVAACALVAILGFAVVGGFRSSPWLDDTWYFWLPKGRALDLVGLDPRLWQPNPRLHMVFGHDYESLWFIRPDNPLWWSILLNLDLRFVGSVDLRAVDAQLAFLAVAFVASTARLLWGRVRASILLPGLLVIVSAPEFLRQTQGGDADVPLAIFLALALLCAAGWLAEKSRLALGLFVLFAATAIAIKSEGVLELTLELAVLTLPAWRARRRLGALWIGALAALATSTPWFAWRAAHGVGNVFSVGNLVSPTYLHSHAGLLHDALRVLGHHFASIREWSLIVPLTIALTLVGLGRERRAAWLAPAAFLVLGYLLFVWITWADPEGAFRLVASSYRYVTPPMLSAAIFLPVLGERLLQSFAQAGSGEAG
jgi:hypothetical protein